jgi:glucokinase
VTRLTSARSPAARLLGDVGGTNARFAWQDAEGAPLCDAVTLPCAAFASLADAMRAYLHQAGRAAPPCCAIGIANPVTGDQVRMTNHHWAFSVAALRSEFGFEWLVVINDFAALALALLDLAPHELHQVGGGTPVPDAALALIGPGTGLGVSGLLPTGEPGRWVALHGEGGHVTLAPGNAREAAVLHRLQQDHGHASAERAVSGQGLVALRKAVCELDGLAAGPPFSASEISARALDGSDAACVEALDLFCAFLGVAGNLALTLGARGDVYIGGGIVPRLGTAFERSRFRVCSKPRGAFAATLNRCRCS